MFFAKNKESKDNKTFENLMIFGDLKCRRGAELKVMSAVEHKRPKHFTNGEELLLADRIKGDLDVDGWGLDRRLLSNHVRLSTVT